MTPTTDYVPAGADLAELCTRFRPPGGRICLALIRDGVWLAPCDQCQELLGQLLAPLEEGR